MTTDKFRGGMHDDICAVLDRPDQIGGPEGIVHDHRDAAAVRDLRDRVDVRDIAVRIAQSLQEDGPGVLRDGRLDLGKVVDVHEIGLDAVQRQRVLKEVERAAVDGLLRDDASAARGESLEGVRDGRGAGSDREGRAPALQGRETLLQDLLGGVGQTAVDIAGIREAEAVRRVLTVVENVGRGLVDRDRAGIRRRIRLLLSHVQLQSFKSVFAHDRLLIFFISF